MTDSRNGSATPCHIGSDSFQSPPLGVDGFLPHLTHVSSCLSDTLSPGARSVSHVTTIKGTWIASRKPALSVIDSLPFRCQSLRSWLRDSTPGRFKQLPGRFCGHFDATRKVSIDRIAANPGSPNQIGASLPGTVERLQYFFANVHDVSLLGLSSYVKGQNYFRNSDHFVILPIGRSSHIPYINLSAERLIQPPTAKEPTP